jgi:uncharacterized delta-60 repeat protein
VPRRQPRPPLRPEPLEDRLAPAAAGTLDPSFGDGGIVSFPTDPENLTPIKSAVAQPDGRVVVVVQSNLPADPLFAMRLMADGRADPAFGTSGKAELPFHTVFKSAVQPDGSLLLVGNFANKTGVGMARVRANGQLDPTFGNNGTDADGFANVDPPFAIAVRPDGRILLLGQGAAPNPGQSTPATAMTVTQLTADGVPDTTFGTGGVTAVTFPVGEYNSARPNAVVVQPDGRVVLAGGALTNSEPVIIRGLVTTFTDDTYDFAAVRLTEDGRLDPTFGDGGRVRISLPSGVRTAVMAAEVSPDGRIVLASVSDAGQHVTARLTADGRLDSTYADNGITRGTPSGFTDDVVGVLPDGRVVYAGSYRATETENGLDLLRLSADGLPDPGFNFVPLVGASLPQTLVTPEPIVQPDGNLIFAGGNVVVRVLGSAPYYPVTDGAILAGGSPDGSARVLAPDESAFTPSEAIAYFPDFPGTVRTATADVTGDGVPDLLGGAGPGGTAHVRVFDGKTGSLVGEVTAFESTFTGGVFVAAADLTGDGKADLVVTPDQGGGPVVAVYDGAKLIPLPDNGGAAAQLARYFGIEDANFRGGARPAVGDLTGDGTADVVAAAGFLGGPRVTIWDGKSVLAGGPAAVANFFAFEDTLRNGTFVAVGDVTGDGRADLAFGGGPGGGPRVRLFDGQQLLSAGPFVTLDEVPAAQRANFFAGDDALRGGVRLALRDADADGKADLTTGSGDGEPSRVRVYMAGNLLEGSIPAADQELDPFGAVLANGVFVG